jgi:hypothetical protein
MTLPAAGTAVEQANTPRATAVLATQETLASDEGCGQQGGRPLVARTAAAGPRLEPHVAMPTVSRASQRANWMLCAAARQPGYYEPISNRQLLALLTTAVQTISMMRNRFKADQFAKT